MFKNVLEKKFSGNCKLEKKHFERYQNNMAIEWLPYFKKYSFSFQNAPLKKYIFEGFLMAGVIPPPPFSGPT